MKSRKNPVTLDQVHALAQLALGSKDSTAARRQFLAALRATDADDLASMFALAAETIVLYEETRRSMAIQREIDERRRLARENDGYS